MPNHIQNELTFMGKPTNVWEVLDFIKHDSTDGKNEEINFERPIEADNAFPPNEKYFGTIDFNKIIPIPKEVPLHAIDQDGTEIQWSMSNELYDWSIENWGTKWNAYDMYWDGDNTIRFCTAWSNVAKMIKILSDKFPKVTFTYSYADEDLGSQVGKIVFLGGRVMSMIIPEDGSAQAYEMAFEIRQSCAEEYGLVYDEETHNYRYDEEVFEMSEQADLN